MALKELIDYINNYCEGKYKAKVARNYSGISVNVPSKKIEYILFDKDTFSPGIWGIIRHYDSPLSRDPEDDGEWYFYLRRKPYDKIVAKLKKIIARKKQSI